MTTLIASVDLPKWVPGKILLSSDSLGWNNVSLRSYRYTGLDVEVPAMSDFMIVLYRQGVTPMQRRFDGAWSKEQCAPGDVSLLTRSQKSHWHWTAGIDVTHIYLTQTLMSKVAESVMDRAILDVRLRDILRIQDPVIFQSVADLVAEAENPGLGGPLYVEAIATKMAVRLLRQYSSVLSREPRQQGRLTPAQFNRLTQYIEDHLAEPLSLEDLANTVSLSTWHFLRRFRDKFGVAPHAYVIHRRVERAKLLLRQGAFPIKEVALQCGFSDQAHMTRTLRSRLGVTPSSLRPQ
ncbi:MAG: helix-turn-helix transcriptional regulator [Betaproteobacteria bacterium]|nr:helix-turn-helix transcriptional regulator [Betaproteobacteria bacterium]